MQDVKEYREAIYQAMIAMTDAEGNPLVSAEEAKAGGSGGFLVA